MKMFITGIYGFVGSAIAIRLRQLDSSLEISGMDNFIPPGSEINRSRLKTFSIRVNRGDVRNASEFETILAADWVIDAAVNSSVLAVVDSKTSSCQVDEHNLLGTINIFDFRRCHTAGFVSLSTNPVHSIPSLHTLPLSVKLDAFVLAIPDHFPPKSHPPAFLRNFPHLPQFRFMGQLNLPQTKSLPNMPMPTRSQSV